jgi:DNA-binding transcriptional MerR regulator
MNHKELFQIGEVARLFHLSAGTLRHYEQMGMLKPEFVDENTGYRYYSTRQFESLNTIRYLRMMDVPLPEIGKFLKNRDIDTIQNLLLQQKEVIKEKQRKLQIVERKIDNRLQQLHDALSFKLDEISIVKEPERRIAWIRNEVAPQTYLDLEKSIRKLDSNQTQPIIFLGKVGLGITIENLHKKKVNRYDMVFVLLDKEDEYEGLTEHLPETPCVTVRFRGRHVQAPAYYLNMLDYIEEHHLTITGFAREITLIDNGLTNDKTKFVTEIQIPVSHEEEKR